MTDQESPEFTVVDRRRGTQENSEATPEAQSKIQPEAPVEPAAPVSEKAPAAPSETPMADAEDTDASQNEEYRLPDPNILLSMVAMQVDARSLATALLPLFDGLAWRALGLIADPQTGEPQKDLPTAQLAIDCVQFFLGKVESSLSEPERRDAQRRLNDLRMNYLAKLREA